MMKILTALFCILAFSSPSSAGNGYIFPDYHRVFMKDRAVMIYLGIYADGDLFLKLNESEYPIYDLAAFKRGTEQAMEKTQAFQQGEESRKNYFKLRADQSTLPLYSSATAQDVKKGRYFLLVFDHHSDANRYPIKIIFHDGALDLQTFDVSPGELQYLQEKIDIVLEQKEEYITRAKALGAENH